MRKFLYFFFGVLLILGITSCKDESDDTMQTIRLQMELNDDVTQIGDVVETEQGRISISDCKLYLSDLYVHYANGDSVLWAEIALIDFEENKTLENKINPLPKRSVVAVSGGLGLNPNMNEGVDPSEFSPEHPLSFQSSNGMHWGWETGYKFLVFDAVVDTGSGNFDWPISYHVGTSELYKRFKIATVNESGNLILVEDLNGVFTSEVLQMSVKENPQTHTINNVEVAEKFRDAFISSLTIK
tara:strand:- start:150417 stop:151142 length:726 start_codon:yes stop_codon:yes gene_type:complete